MQRAGPGFVRRRRSPCIRHFGRSLLRHDLSQGAEAPLQAGGDASIGRRPGDLLLLAPVVGALDLLWGIPEHDAQAHDGHIFPPPQLGRLVHNSAAPPHAGQQQRSCTV